jgi:ABC-type Co2+ transport system permease subunit
MRLLRVLWEPLALVLGMALCLILLPLYFDDGGWGDEGMEDCA